MGISLLLALSLLALLRNREGWSGLSLGFSIIAVKFLSLLFAPVIFLAARHRVKWTISFLIFPIAGYGAVALFGAHPVDQVVFHALTPSSGNLPFLLTATGILPLTAPQYRVVIDCLAFMLLCGTFIAAILRFGRPDPPHLVLLLRVCSVDYADRQPKGVCELSYYRPIPVVSHGRVPTKAAYTSGWFRSNLQSGHVRAQAYGFGGCRKADWICSQRPIPRNVTQTRPIFLLCELLLVGGYILACGDHVADDGGLSRCPR